MINFKTLFFLLLTGFMFGGKAWAGSCTIANTCAKCSACVGAPGDACSSCCVDNCGASTSTANKNCMNACKGESTSTDVIEAHKVKRKGS